MNSSCVIWRSLPAPRNSGKSHSHGKEGFSRCPETKLLALKMP